MCITAAATIGYAIIGLLREETDEKNVFERQLKTEQKNKPADKKRIQTLKIQIKDIKNKIDYLEDIIEVIFDEIIEIRCKDVMQEVRSISLKSLALWLRYYPKKFANQTT